MFSKKKNKKIENNFLDNKQEEKKNKSFQKPVDLRNPEVLEVNLVKDEIVVFFNWKKHIIIGLLIIFLTSLFIYEVCKGVEYWEKIEIARAEKIESEIELLKKETVDLNNKASDALLFKEKSQVFTDLLDNHIYWTNFFTWLEKNTINTVKYNGFSGDVSGKYVLEASAPSYAEASWQAKILSDSPYIKDVEIISASRNEETHIEEGEEKEEGEEVEKIVISNVFISFELKFSIEKSIFLSN